MKNKIKRNYMYILLFFVSLNLFIFYSLYEINFFGILKDFIFNTTYRMEQLKIYETSNVFNAFFNLISSVINQNGFDYNIIWGTNIFQIFIPFIEILGIIIYYREHQKVKAQNVFLTAFKIAVSIFLSYMIFYLITYLLTNSNFDKNITGEIFLDILGRDFYFNHTYLYYFIDGSVKFFVIPLIYTASGIFISSNFNNKHSLNYIIILFYFGFSPLMSIFEHLFNINFLYLNPTAIMVSNIYPNINTILILLFNVGILISSFLFFKLYNKKINLSNYFCVFLTLTIFLINFISMFVYNKNIDFTIIYKNISYFIIYITLIYKLINDCINDDNNYNFKFLVVKIIKIILIFTIFLFLIIIISLLVSGKQIEFIKLIYCFVDFSLLFLTVTLYCFLFDIIFKKNLNKLKYSIIFILIIIYSINYLYNGSVLFINIFKYYLLTEGFYPMIFYYLIWILIPVIIIITIDDTIRRNKNDSTK